MRKTLACVSTLFLVGFKQPADAAHPLVTEDSDTQGRGNSQIELNTDRARFAGETGRVAAFTYSHGATDALDLYGNLPVSLASPSGKGDVSFGAKWRFRQGERTSLAFKPELFLATGNASKGLGNGSASLGFTLIASHGAGRWGFDGNIGLTANRYREPLFGSARHSIVWRVSGALAYSVNEQWTLVADTGIARNTEKAGRTHPVFILAGVVYSPRRDVDIDVGIRAGLNAAEVHRQAGAGLTVRF